MCKIGYIKQLNEIDVCAYNEIIRTLKTKNISEMDICNEDISAYCYNDDCKSADNIKINRIILENNELCFIGENGVCYGMNDFHIGTMPYIYAGVKEITECIPNNKKRYEVQIQYSGCFTTSVEAENESEAVELVRNEVSSLSELDFLDAIDICESGHDVFLYK